MLYEVITFSAEPAILERTKTLVREEMSRVYPQLQAMKAGLRDHSPGLVTRGEVRPTLRRRRAERNNFV